MNKVSHFHIPVNDMDRAKTFYNSIFGWKIINSKAPETDKHFKMVTTTPVNKSGMPKEIGGINGAFFIRETPEDHISIVIRVPSIEEYLKKIEETGCKIITKKTPVDNIGFHAKFYDTENNIIELWEENYDRQQIVSED